MRSHLATLTLLLALGCGGATGPVGFLEPGVWGGDRVNLIVTRDSARAEFDCASGRLDWPIGLDSLGRFDVGGSYRFEAGPVGAAVPAHWSGVVQPGLGGPQVTLSVTVLDPHAEPYVLGPFHLKSGVRLTLGLCA
jgi:hypothetical protein